jgi:hypothetical protein
MSLDERAGQWKGGKEAGRQGKINHNQRRSLVEEEEREREGRGAVFNVHA